MPISMQPPPYYAPFSEKDGTIAEPWKRFLLATQTSISFLLNTQQRVGSLQGLLPIEDFEDDRFALAIPGATGTPGTGGAIQGTIGATQVAFGVATNTIGGDPGFIFTAATGATLTAPAGATALTLAGGTQTASFPVLSATQTWNNVATTFTALKLNVTNTASAVGSLLQDWQVGAISQASVQKDGLFQATRVYLSSSGGTGSSFGSILSVFSFVTGITQDIFAVDLEPGVAGSLAIPAGKNAYGLYNEPYFTEAASGVHALIVGARFEAPVLTNGVATTTEASTVYIGAAPTLGVSNYSLHVIGASLFAGATTIGTSLITLAGAFTTSGANALTLTTTGPTNVTLPTSGTLLASPVILTSQVTGILPVANGGTATGTAFTVGSVVFAGAAGVYTQNNAKFFWDDVNGRLGIGTNAPGVGPLHSVSTGVASYFLMDQWSGAAGTAPIATTFLGRSGRGTAGSPTALVSGDILFALTGRGASSAGFPAADTGQLRYVAAEAFTATAQGTYAAVFTTPTGTVAVAEAMRVHGSGGVSIGDTTDPGIKNLRVAGTVNVVGGQVIFPAAQAASSGANTLDDYEEGTWTPTDGSGASLSFTVTSAFYVKVGRLVHISVHLAYPVTASGAAASIAGLPFAQSYLGGVAIGYANSAVNLHAYFPADNTIAFIVNPTAVAVTNGQMSAVTVVLTGTYTATA